MTGRPPKEVRKYAKTRYNYIIQPPNYVPNENYPKNAFKFVAWWNERFATGEPPASSVIEAEISARNPQFHEGPIILETTGKPIAERTTGTIPADKKSPASRIGTTQTEDPHENPSLAERIGGSLGTRIHGDLKSRIKLRSIYDRINGGGRIDKGKD